MVLNDIPFGTTDWSTVETTEHAGESGVAQWHTIPCKGGIAANV